MYYINDGTHRHIDPDEPCSFCDERSVIIIAGSRNGFCGTCGNEIALCYSHFQELRSVEIRPTCDNRMVVEEEK